MFNRPGQCPIVALPSGGLNARRAAAMRKINRLTAIRVAPVLPFLAARTISRCLGCRTEKRVEAARLGNTVAMTHYRRIVNACGHQQWHGHDRYDKGHPTLPYVAWYTPRPEYHPRASLLALPRKNARVLPAEHRPAELTRSGGYRRRIKLKTTSPHWGPVRTARRCALLALNGPEACRQSCLLTASKVAVRNANFIRG